MTAGHRESGSVPFKHLQQLTKLLGRQKQRGIHGANFRVCIPSVDEGPTKTPSTATTESWVATDLFWFGCLYGLMFHIEASKEGVQRVGVSLWPLL